MIRNSDKLWSVSEGLIDENAVEAILTTGDWWWVFGIDWSRSSWDKHLQRFSTVFERQILGRCSQAWSKSIWYPPDAVAAELFQDALNYAAVKSGARQKRKALRRVSYHRRNWFSTTDQIPAGGSVANTDCWHQQAKSSTNMVHMLSRIPVLIVRSDLPIPQDRS